MSAPFTAYGTALTQQLAPAESPVVLLEFAHAAFAVPLRIINDNAALVSNGAAYAPCAFSINWPDDGETDLPRAQLSLDNTGNQFGNLLELTAGAKGGTCTLKMVFRSSPNIIERERVLQLSNITLTPKVMGATLGYEDILNKPSVHLVYREYNAPGLY